MLGYKYRQSCHRPPSPQYGPLPSSYSFDIPSYDPTWSTGPLADLPALSPPDSTSQASEGSPESRRYETQYESGPKLARGTEEIRGQAMSNNYDLYTPASTYDGYPSISQVSGTSQISLPYSHYKPSQQHSRPVSRPGSRAPSPVHFEKPTVQDSNSGRRYSSQHAVASYLLLPFDISNGKGNSLAGFSAEITCLFWFESAARLIGIEGAAHNATPSTGLLRDAIPTVGFRKWVTTILTTTQVSTSVVLLALLFIFRLKKQNPHVNGKVGSEYRLLTVALMLGNKFLDDNTYTNKTWAEVSGIDVKEIHVMEVEFLSHMKYNLYTSKEQWKDWFQQLRKFWDYHELASALPLVDRPRPTTQRPSVQIPEPLPSPPASTTESPPYASAASPESSIPSSSSAVPQYMSTSTASPATSVSDFEHSASSASSRKRSWEQVAQEGPVKRQQVAAPSRQYTPISLPPPGSSASSRAETLPSLQSLPMLQAYAQLQGPKTQQRTYQPENAFPTPQSMLSHPQSGRNTPATFLPPANWLQGLPQPSGTHRPTNAMAYALSSAQKSNYPSRHQTPTASFQAMNPFENQPQLSPTHYLAKRTSPYRPVRHLSQLTQAPPSSHMYEYPAQVSYDQIQWQPLRKVTQDREIRTGRVPYYHDPYAWPVSQQYQPTSAHAGHPEAR